MSNSPELTLETELILRKVGTSWFCFPRNGKVGCTMGKGPTRQAAALNYEIKVTPKIP